MDPRHIEFTIPDLSLFIGFGLLVFAITTYLAISNHREKLKPLFATLRSPSKYALPLVFLILLPLAAIAVYDIYGLITNTEAWQTDKRGLAVLLAAITGAPFVIWRTWIAQKQSATAEQSHMTDRITKAVEQLGAEKTIWVDGNQQSVPNLEVRLGAIYALERITQDSLRDHIQIMEILCAYIRGNSPASSAVSFPKSTGKKITLLKWKNSVPVVPSDIQVAIDVIARRKKAQIQQERAKDYRLDLRNANLQRANFQQGEFDRALFSNSNLALAFMANVKLTEALFAQASLQMTEFISAKLRGASLDHAILLLTSFRNADTSLVAVKNTQLETSAKDDNIPNCCFLTEIQINLMFGDATTILPAKMERRPIWPEKELSWEDFFTLWNDVKKKASLL